MTDDLGVSADQEAVENLFREHSPAVFRCALKALRGDRDRAGEVVQQVFFAVWRQFDRDFRGNSYTESAGMIMRITTCRVIDFWRKVAREDAVLVPNYIDSDTPIFGIASTGVDPLERVLSDDALLRLQNILMQALTDTEYQVVLMAWALDMADAAVADALGSSTATVRSHKSRARKKIQKAMNRDGRQITFDLDGVFEEPTGEGVDGGERLA